MSYPIKYPTPQGANVQIFQGGDPQTTGHLFEKTWVKPQGASFVWFTLIGGGGGDDRDAVAFVGGGSGAVTNCMVPAFLIPDSLTVVVGTGSPSNGNGAVSQIFYQQKTGTGYSLLTANGGAGGGSGGAGGVAMTANYFTAMGFFQSIAGQAGGNPTTASATTFLSGGSYSGATTANYGYSTSRSGFFQMQPIIVGVGGGSTSPGKGGVGCGAGGTGGGATTGIGGDGLVVIVTW
jgi:hypothetical protein